MGWECIGGILTTVNIENEFRVLVTGGRDYDDRNRLYKFMDRMVQTINGEGRTRNIRLIHGAAKGADSIAAEWAEERGIPSTAYPADWETYGRSAGAIRNKLMLTEGKPHAIIAFKGGRGTQNMIQQGKKAGVPVYEVKR